MPAHPFPLFLAGLPRDAAAVGGMVLALFAAPAQLRRGRVPRARDAEGWRRWVLPAGDANLSLKHENVAKT